MDQILILAECSRNISRFVLIQTYGFHNNFKVQLCQFGTLLSYPLITLRPELRCKNMQNLTTAGRFDCVRRGHADALQLWLAVSSLPDFPELPVSIDYRAWVRIGSWIFSHRIKISSCLPVWDAPCWPTCWVWCEMCVQALRPYYPPEGHACRAGRTHCPHLLISPSTRHSRPPSPLFSALVFHLSSLTPTAKLSACFYSAPSPSCTPRWQQISKENVSFLLLSRQK